MEEWKEYKLKDVADFQKGFAFKSIDYVDKGIRIIKVSNLNQNNFSNCVYIKEDYALSYVKYELCKDDIVISTVGSWPNNPESVVGKVSRIPTFISGSLLNQNAVRLRAKCNFNQNFLYYILSCSLFSSYIASTAQGSANQASITLEDIKNYSFLCPNYKEQLKITSLLQSLDDKIEVNRQTNEILEQQAQAIFKAWFVDFEPFKNGEFVESELGMIPKGWSVKKLGAIIEEMPKSTIQVNRARTAQGQYPFFTSGSSVYQYDSLIVSGRNIFLNTGGAAGVRFYIGGAAYSTDTWCIKGIGDYSDFIYLYLAGIVDLLNSQYFEGSALKHLKKKVLKERQIVIPPSDVINNFNMIVRPMHDKININSNLKKSLSSIRDTLLPRLMSGELEVNDIESL